MDHADRIENMLIGYAFGLALGLAVLPLWLVWGFEDPTLWAALTFGLLAPLGAAEMGVHTK